jgi:hypothetical protein
MKTRIFLTEVPDELFLELLKPLGYLQFSDGRWMDKRMFTPAVLQRIEELMVLVEPYYRDFAKEYVIREMNHVNFFLVIRQICRQKGMVLETREAGRKKITQYGLITNRPPDSLVRFDE